MSKPERNKRGQQGDKVEMFEIFVRCVKQEHHLFAVRCAAVQCVCRHSGVCLSINVRALAEMQSNYSY